MVDATLLAVSAVSGLVLGPLIVRMLAGVAPGGLRLKAAKWQINRGLAMGDRWLLLQSGDRDYEFEHYSDDTEFGGKLGHIDTGTRSIPFGVGYSEQAVAESQLVKQQEEPAINQSRPETQTAQDLLDADAASNGHAGGEA